MDHHVTVEHCHIYLQDVYSQHRDLHPCILIHVYQVHDDPLFRFKIQLQVTFGLSPLAQLALQLLLLVYDYFFHLDDVADGQVDIHLVEEYAALLVFQLLLLVFNF